jgi:hypothetical protein
MFRERREHAVFKKLLQSVPGLEERLMVGSDEEIQHITDMVGRIQRPNESTESITFQIQKGASNARSDDTKSLKGAVLDWITPRGQVLTLPLSRNVKIDRGFHHERTGALLCPAGMEWANHE